MKNRLDELTKAYWSATLTQEELSELKELLASQSSLNEEQHALKMMICGFEALAQEHQPQEIAPKRGRAKIIRLALTLSTAAAAIIAVGVITLSPTGRTTPEPEILCYINGEPITDIEVALEQTKYLSNLSKLSQAISKLKAIEEL